MHAVAELRVIVAGLTHPGRVRSNNEDAFAIAPLEGDTPVSGERSVPLDPGGHGVLLAVSDGMGGAAAGEIASALSLEALVAGLRRTADRDSTVDANRLRHLVEDASRAVFEAGQRPSRRGMGATLTAVLVCGDGAHVAQIGDSRAYLIRARRIVQLTHDQSWVQELVDHGVLTPEEAASSPQRNVIMQVMGQGEPLHVALGRIRLFPGDRLLICSDGLSNVVSDADLLRLGGPPAPADAACRALVDAALAGGAPDNVTVVVGEVVPAAL